MSHLKTPVSSGKRRRASNKAGRRFSVKKDFDQKAALPSPAAFPRKAKKAQHVFRIMVTGALFFILLSTVSSWNARVARRRQRLGRSDGAASEKQRSLRSFFSFRRTRPGIENEEATGSVKDSTSEVVVVDSEDRSNSNETVTSESSSGEAEAVSDQDTADTSGSDSSSKSEERMVDDQPLSLEELPERIEWYTRLDYKDGARPMCRISNPYLLSNGTILVPDWMQNYEKLLQRCGLGTHSFYPSKTGPEGLESLRTIGSDFALTIHPERFQEPTHSTSVYLTEHILKSSYLFDVFSGYAHPVEGVKEHHCYTLENNSTCALHRPAKSLLKPAIFVPKRIETAPKSLWSRQLVDMFGKAHGSEGEVIHLNASTILIKSHEGKSENLVGTGFRSILTTDGMFRHLPPNALQHSNFYSLKNGIDKSPKQTKSEDWGHKFSIGIASSGGRPGGIQGVEDLKQKIEVLCKLAIPKSSIETRLVSFSIDLKLEDHIKEMQDLDIYVGGSGDEMSSVGFLRSSSSAFELMPFGIKPVIHESLAHALGLDYSIIRGQPQVESFKSCIDGEIFNLRKKGTLKFTESPDWEEPVVKAWDAAVSEFVLSGSSSLDILTAQPPINNYHARACALRQNIEVSIDETARKIVLLAKEKISSR